jgi:hypothetical protein
MADCLEGGIYYDEFTEMQDRIGPHLAGHLSTLRRGLFGIEAINRVVRTSGLLAAHTRDGEEGAPPFSDYTVDGLACAIDALSHALQAELHRMAESLQCFQSVSRESGAARPAKPQKGAPRHG